MYSTGTIPCFSPAVKGSEKYLQFFRQIPYCVLQRAVPAQDLSHGPVAPGDSPGNAGNGFCPGFQVVDVHNWEPGLAEFVGQLRPKGIDGDAPLGYQYINAGAGGGDAPGRLFPPADGCAVL